MSIHLSARLRAIADKVPFGGRIIDVGTDHAMLPVWLVQTGKISHAWACDVRSGPLQSARRLIDDTGTGDRIDIKLTDGLTGLGPEDGDTIIIAGMGGETMRSILSAASWTRENTLLILEPQSKQAELRRWLFDSGYAIVHESLIKDTGRLYPILLARGGHPMPHTESELHTGALSLIKADPLFPEYLVHLSRRAAAAAPYDDDAKQLLESLLSMKEQVKSCGQ